MAGITFPTLMIVVPTSFFLGLIFSLFPYDYPLLWSSAPLEPSHLDLLEAHLKLLHASPNLILRIMHIITAIGLLGLVAKLYNPSESNMLFDGGSLVLYMIAIIVYLTNIVKGLRIVTVGEYGEGLKGMTQDRFDEVDSAGYDESGGSVLGREDNLKVLAASNVIVALVLVGVLVLQVGQWYAERVEERERAKLEAAESGEDAKKGKSAKGKKKD